MDRLGGSRVCFSPDPSMKSGSRRECLAAEEYGNKLAPFVRLFATSVSNARIDCRVGQKKKILSPDTSGSLPTGQTERSHF
ncbi:hypothetical protein L596_028817 [Steinernema carpocapsae]|uniref:Uncharacterized protein n=1 Tax=Steinernema carpocapsae TaxID=34508 RepID=A0A4U5LZF7_STECR|nr:hypothetical protein L596_028817 [Steinernema carpocapsae]